MPRPSKGARLWYDKAAGRWYVRDGTAKRGTGCALEDLEGAERALAAYVADKYDPPRHGRTSALKVADVLLFYAREVAPRHRSRTWRYAVTALDRWWEDRPLSDIRRSSCKAYIAHRMSQGHPQAKHEEAKARRTKESTAGRELTVLRAAINAFHAETPLDALPVVFVPPRAPGRDRWLTRDEAARLLKAVRAMDDRDASRALKRFILIGLYTGTRSRAIRDLRWSKSELGGWVDLERGIMHRRAIGEAETKKRKPPVRIPRRIRHFLERWHREDAGAVETVIHYRRQPVQAQRDSLAAARDAAGLGKDVTAHTLRHTAATWMLNAGVPAWEVAQYTGMSVEVLESVYGHHDPDFQGPTSDKVGRRH